MQATLFECRNVNDLLVGGGGGGREGGGMGDGRRLVSQRLVRGIPGASPGVS